MRRNLPLLRTYEPLEEGAVTIAAITSCTNTSNPSVLIAAGLVAKAANERGMKVKPWVKTSLAPGSQVVTDYLKKAGLQHELDTLGFNLVGYGCTTVSGIQARCRKKSQLPSMKMIWLSPRCFRATVTLKAGSAPMRANYLASPPLVVAYALAGLDARRYHHRACR